MFIFKDIPLKLTEETMKKEEFRELLIKSVQKSTDPTKMIVQFLFENKESIISLVELLKR